VYVCESEKAKGAHINPPVFHHPSPLLLCCCDVTEYFVQAAPRVQTSRPANLLSLQCVASAIWYYDGTMLIEFLLSSSWLPIGNAAAEFN